LKGGGGFASPWKAEKKKESKRKRKGKGDHDDEDEPRSDPDKADKALASHQVSHYDRKRNDIGPVAALFSPFHPDLLRLPGLWGEPSTASEMLYGRSLLLLEGAQPSSFRSEEG